MKNKKALIMDAAMSLIEKYGISKLTVSDIAIEAKIGKGTVYEYFNSKDEIFIETLKYGALICVNELNARTFKNNPNHKQAIYNFIECSKDIIESKAFITMSTDSKLFAFDKEYIEKIKISLRERFIETITIVEKINMIGIKENITKKPKYNLTHFTFTNMVFSILFQKRDGHLDKDIDIYKYLYETTLKIYN